MWQNRWIQLGVTWAVWTLIGFFFTCEMYLNRVYMERPEPWFLLLSIVLPYCYIWALATPVILWLAGRFPIGRHRLFTNLLIHIFFCGSIVIIATSANNIIYYLRFIKGLGKPYSPLSTFRAAIANLNEGVMIYGLIILVNYARTYYHKYQDEVVSKMQLKTQLAEAQLQALKMQLHPHFLFNTLHSISALINKDTEAARKMISRLGDFLRLTLQNSETQNVTLQQEMEFLACYLEIERVRFHDRLTTHIDIEPQALEAQVPHLILQPIVENAIRYGTAPRSTPGRIEIRAERNNAMLYIQVRDNGPGIPMILNANNPVKEGLGLANTQARLRQLYGEAHHFELANDPKGGLVVTLEIPYTRGITN